jgi:hypothetical protein
MSYTTAQLQSQFNDLPEELQGYIMGGDVAEAGSNLAEWFEIGDKEVFGEILFALVIGTVDGAEFVRLAQDKLGLDEETAGDLFVEIGIRIMDEAYEIMEESIKEASGDSVTATAPKAATIPTMPQAPAPRASGEARRFVGIPSYGFEKPASSYTSVLPRSEIEVNKLKDTPTADSFIKKLSNLGNQGMGSSVNTVPSATPIPTPAPSPAPSAPAKSLTPAPSAPKTVPPPSNLPVLKKDEPETELAKLSRPISLPRKEVTMTTQAPQPATPPGPSKTYAHGSDPYREMPTID